MKFINTIISITKTKFEFIKIIMIVIGVGGGGAPQLSFAYPVLDSVDVQITSATSANYAVVWHNDTLLDNNAAIKAYLPIPNGVFGLAHRHKDSNMNIVANMYTDNGKAIVFRYDTTWAALGKEWTSGSSGGTLKIEHSGVENGNECVGLIASNKYPGASWSSILIPYQGAKCLGTPPADNWCALKTPEITLNYGTLTADNAVGTKKSANVIVECTDAIDYTLRLRGKDQIPLTNGMNVTLTANNGPLINTTLHGTKGDNSVVIEGTLNGTPVDGAFSGSEVLMVSYP